MAELADFLAVDLGASGGRVLLGRWDGNAFDLQEVHRFPNGPVGVLGHLHWDVLRLWGEIQAGLARYATGAEGRLAGIGLDTWGVDLGLLDANGRLLGNPYHYRDTRTNGVLERAFRQVPRREIFEQTGLQFIQFNTLFQLFSMVETAEPQLAAAHDMLMLPDLFHYWLTGRKVAEYTIASTSQMLDARTRGWATALLDRFGISARMLPEIVTPGTILGPTRAEVVDEACLRAPVPVIAVGSHDTASAVAAIPDLDRRQRLYQQWHLVSDRHGSARADHQRSVLGAQLHQRRRRRQHDPPSQERDRPVAAAGEPAPVAARGP